MKITQPYELLIRFGIEGAVSGAHVKTQSYYMDGLLPDLATWREDQAATADLDNPLIKKWCDEWSVALHRDAEALREVIASKDAELESLRQELADARAAQPEAAP